MRFHRLKTWPKYFSAVVVLQKHCELRKADRDFKVGDYLRLDEFDPMKDAYTGRAEVLHITHILTAEDAPRGLCEGFVVLSTEPASGSEADAILGRTTSHRLWGTPQEVMPS